MSITLRLARRRMSSSAAVSTVRASTAPAKAKPVYGAELPPLHENPKPSEVRYVRYTYGFAGASAVLVFFSFYWFIKYATWLKDPEDLSMHHHPMVTFASLDRRFDPAIPEERA